ncbi:MAG: DNA repair protein RecN [Gammaproteobacteria bacterium]|nr:DNA repair protein RecN [Gammaproteobacteria bacterium]
MLRELDISQLAVVEQLTVEFGGGFTVLTGETGAGKSILLDGLHLALGGRASSDLVRHGASRADVNADFSLDDAPEALAWLQTNSLDDDENCLLRRTLTADGRSRSFINGQPVPAQSARDLGRLLLDIHGQHEHQHLLQGSEQMEVLDSFSGAEALVAESQRLHGEWASLAQRLTDLEAGQNDSRGRQELLHYQISELQQLGLQPGEWAELESEQQRLSHAREILEQGETIMNRLSAEDHSALTALETADRELAGLVELAPGLGESHQLLTSAVIEVQEAVQGLRRELERVELDPERLAHVNQRIGDALDLARKHRIKPDELPEQLVAMEAAINELTGGHQNIEALRVELDRLHADYFETASQLSRTRRGGADRLTAAVTAELHKLGMAAARFEVELTPLTRERPSPRGLEETHFLISTNPGAPARPLSRVASGGELSRLSLAIQSATMAQKSVPTLLFDEVDAGIGGAVADVVGQQLRQLGESRQVICITHLPQIAAQGNDQLRVEKITVSNSAVTTIEKLQETDRVEELARMLGGSQITEKARDHARELLTSWN